MFIPGIFLAVSFLFFTFAVGVEDQGIVDGLKRSWELSRGDRLKLSVLVILAGVIGFISGIVGTLFDISNAAIIGELIVNALNSILFVLLYGIIAVAYLQVQGDSPERVDTSGVSESLDSIGS